MADITYCASDCPFRDCERHKSKISDAAIRGKEYISVSDFAPTCRRYIAHVVGKVATNADLIDRRALLEHIKDVPTWSQVLGEGYRPNKYPAGMYDPGDIISSVENAPSIDAVPVRRGKWIPEKDTHKCSKCGFGMFMNMGYYFMDGECIFSGGETFMHKYCPNCGAKMDGGEDDAAD